MTNQWPDRPALNELSNSTKTASFAPFVRSLISQSHCAEQWMGQFLLGFIRVKIIEIGLFLSISMISFQFFYAWFFSSILISFLFFWFLFLFLISIVMLSFLCFFLISFLICAELFSISLILNTVNVHLIIIVIVYLATKRWMVHI